MQICLLDEVVIRKIRIDEREGSESDIDQMQCCQTFSRKKCTLRAKKVYIKYQKSVQKVYVL